MSDTDPALHEEDDAEDDDTVQAATRTSLSFLRASLHVAVSSEFRKKEQKTKAAKTRSACVIGSGICGEA